MKKLKLTKKGKKIIGVLAAIASLLLIFLIFLVLSLKSDTSKTYDLESLAEILPYEFEELSLRKMDEIDILNDLGMYEEETTESLYISSYKFDDKGNEIIDNKTYIAIINTENYEHYYDLLYSHVDATIRYSENEEQVKLYRNAILKKGKNYVYLIISEQAEEIERSINF